MDKFLKVWKITKGFIYAVAAVIVIVLAETLIHEDNIKFFIGGLMVFYGVPEIIIALIQKKAFEHTKFYWSCIETLLGIIILVSESDYVAVCSGWAIWSILREAFEIEEAVHNTRNHRPGILSLIESTVCIVFAILLLYHPSEHHAIVHAKILLPIELATTGVVFPLLELLFEKVINPKRLARENSNNSDN